MLKTVKFGGSSVAGAQQFEKVRDIVRSDPSRRVVVVSAAGKRCSDDHKITDLLYLCHAHLTYGVSCDDILNTIQQRFVEIRDTLGLTLDIESEFAALRGRLNKDFPVDELVSRGEYFTSRLMAEYLGYTFLDSADCVFFGADGHVNREKTYAAIDSALKEHGALVIPGFYGSLPSGRIRVMSRGGSDISGALAAAATGSDVYENWTDVSGILMADPRIVQDPSPIAQITYSELRELAFMGASVLHEDSILPVKEMGIPLNIRNTNRPQDAGTLIVESIQEPDAAQERFITGIAGRRNFTILTLRKRDMDSIVSLRQALKILEHHHVPVEHITLGLDTFALVSATSALGDQLYDIIGEMQRDCAPDDIQARDDIALVAVVGRKMTSRPGTSGKIFQALGNHGINICTIAQGADELSIIVGVDNRDFDTAIRVLYDGFAG
ncbi:MAG: aspartate kinase [Clostridia bacterium]|nr:aspartate kinase [Clostridia bacterium]MDY2929201.1 aspartate kinase [Clostridiaceae bacterium]